MNVYDIIAKWIATQLDKLKVKNPLVYLFIQGNLGTILTLFVNDTINIVTPPFILQWAPWLEFDGTIIALLAALMAAISPRTTFLANKSEEKI